MWDHGIGIKNWMISEYKETILIPKIDLRGKWKGLKVDKRDIKVKCPRCENVFCALIGNSMTIELSLKRKGTEREHNKTAMVIYGTSCPKCKKKFRFKVVYDAFYYPKLGEY